MRICVRRRIGPGIEVCGGYFIGNMRRTFGLGRVGDRLRSRGHRKPVISIT
ncbi:hypothetical protein ACVOMV_38020 [Mesorhizobium atlanticum]